VKIISVLTFFLNMGLCEPSRILYFFKQKKNWLSSLAVFINSKKSVFFTSFHKLDVKLFNFFLKYYFLTLFFWQKFWFWIYIQQFINPQFHLFQKLLIKAIWWTTRILKEYNKIVEVKIFLLSLDKQKASTQMGLSNLSKTTS